MFFIHQLFKSLMSIVKYISERHSMIHQNVDQTTQVSPTEILKQIT